MVAKMRKSEEIRSEINSLCMQLGKLCKEEATCDGCVNKGIIGGCCDCVVWFYRPGYMAPSVYGYAKKEPEAVKQQQEPVADISKEIMAKDIPGQLKLF